MWAGVERGVWSFENIEGFFVIGFFRVGYKGYYVELVLVSVMVFFFEVGD